MNQTHVITTWLLYFFMYSFLGWVWESCYVSVLQHKWINRGFIKGPFLPLYGSGAIMMLLVSQPFADNLIGVYFAGVVGATLLEYVTGALMEALFKVRYWDYSNQKFNIKGYICLTSSIAWGFFTILMTQYVHPFLISLIELVPPLIQNVSLIIITVSFSYDFIMAFKNALQLRFLLEKLSAARTDLADLTEKLEGALKANLASAKTALNGNLDTITNSALLKELSERKAAAAEFLQKHRRLERTDSTTFRQYMSALPRALEHAASSLKNNRITLPAPVSERLLHWKEPYQKLMASVTDRQRKLLKNHSHVVSEKYAAELELLKEDLNHRENKNSNDL
jgi:uncharacterized membrane protein